MELQQMQTDLEALSRASALVAEWVFEAHERSEGDDFTSYRDKCMGALEVFEPQIRNLESLIEERVSNIKAQSEAQDLIAAASEESERIKKEVDESVSEEAVAPPPPKQTKQAKAKKPAATPTGNSMKPDAQKILDDLLNQISATKQTTRAPSSYPTAKVGEDIPSELKSCLQGYATRGGMDTLAPDLLEQLSAEHGVSKLRIAEYFGWLLR